MVRTALLCGWLFTLLATLPVEAQQEEAIAAPDADSRASGDSGAGSETQESVAAPLTAGEGSAGRDPRVIGAVSRSSEFPNRAALGDTVIVEVEGLASLLSPDSKVRCSDLVLFLNAIAIQGSPPESCSPDEGRVRFLLDRTSKSDHAWRTLLAEPSGFVKTISVSIGAGPELAYPTNVRNFELEILPRVELFCYLGILVIGIALFARLAGRTSILREPGVIPEGQHAPFSLSRCQLAFWSILVIAAYVFIWMITEELDTVTGSVLVLLGIGSGTALGAVLIDSGKETSARSPLSTPGPKVSALPRSRGFLNDLLSDENGISIHRFQLFAWTLVMGVIFCASVYDGLQMPQFSATLLGLMGLSSGTYLGFKMPESKTPGPGVDRPEMSRAPEA